MPVYHPPPPPDAGAWCQRSCDIKVVAEAARSMVATIGRGMHRGPVRFADGAVVVARRAGFINQTGVLLLSAPGLRRSRSVLQLDAPVGREGRLTWRTVMKESGERMQRGFTIMAAQFSARLPITLFVAAVRLLRRDGAPGATRRHWCRCLPLFCVVLAPFVGALPTVSREQR